MISFTKTEIQWIMNMVKRNRDNSKTLMDIPGQQYAALHKLEYEKMSSLYTQLDAVHKGKNKRVAIE